MPETSSCAKPLSAREYDTKIFAPESLKLPRFAVLHRAQMALPSDR